MRIQFYSKFSQRNECIENETTITTEGAVAIFIIIVIIFRCFSLILH